MSRKNGSLYFILGFVILFGFQNCGYFDSANSDSFIASSVSDDVCDTALTEFKTGFHKTVRSVNCQTCHDVGNGKLAGSLPFAQTDVNKAYDAFLRYPFNQYIKNVEDNHRSSDISYNSTELSAQLEQHKEGYEKAIEGCKAKNEEANNSLLTNEVESDLYDLTRVDTDNCGFNDAIKISVVQSPFSTAMPQVSTLTWDLGQQDPQWDGVMIQIDVTVSNPNTFPKGGNPQYACPSLVGYLVGNLRVSSSKSKVRIKNIKVFINDDDKDEYSFWNIEQSFAIGSDEKPFDQTGTSFVNYSMDGVSMKANNKWRLFIESIQLEK
jgi:hypothetical protein